MTSKRSGTSQTQITLTVASRRTGLSVRRIRHCMRLRLVGQTLTEAELAQLRRIRRLSELGINLAGIEVILRMRHQILELQDQVRQLRGADRDARQIHLFLPGRRKESSNK
jgi:DNA-binding transcriptional MerR regulator